MGEWEPCARQGRPPPSKSATQRQRGSNTQCSERSKRKQGRLFAWSLLRSCRLNRLEHTIRKARSKRSWCDVAKKGVQFGIGGGSSRKRNPGSRRLGISCQIATAFSRGREGAPRILREWSHRSVNTKNGRQLRPFLQMLKITGSDDRLTSFQTGSTSRTRPRNLPTGGYG